MGPLIDQECPQCGGGIELQETDRFMSCPYCGVSHVILGGDLFRYVLPPLAGDQDYFYVPYLRFKGNVYNCRMDSTESRVVDITQLGAEVNGLPASLGVRPQAVKMRFLNPLVNPGRFFKITQKPAKVLEQVGRLSAPAGSPPFFHRAYVGELLSVIYLPVFLRNQGIHDGLTQRSIGTLPDGETPFQDCHQSKPRWKVTLLAGLCPECGWNLTGASDSAVLTCQNCQSAWEIRGTELQRIAIAVAPATKTKAVYLPFWRIQVKTLGLKMQTYADFLRVTHQPRIIRKEWEDQPLTLWSPAFRIQPKIFLMLARNFTLSQCRFEAGMEFPDGLLHPASLPSSEAAQTLKLTLAESCVVKRDVLPWMPRIRFQTLDTQLTYIPFDEAAHEFVQPQLGLGISKRALEFGRQL